MYKAVLFDLDGTLTDSGEGIMKSVQYALEKIGFPEPDLTKLRVFVGPPLLEQFMEYANIDHETAEAAVRFYRERFAPVGIFENSVYPGVEAMLQDLKSRGYLLAVASSKPEVFVRQVLDHFDLTGYFDVIVGSEMNGERTQKAEVVEEAVSRLGFTDRREEVIMVGDKSHDVIGAATCGINCIAVSYGYGTMEELQGASPLYIADSPQAVTDFFDSSRRKDYRF